MSVATDIAFSVLGLAAGAGLVFVFRAWQTASSIMRVVRSQPGRFVAERAPVLPEIEYATPPAFEPVQVEEASMWGFEAIRRGAA